MRGILRSGTVQLNIVRLKEALSIVFDLSFGFLKGLPGVALSLGLAPLLYYYNVVALYDVVHDYSWLWLCNALYALFFACNQWLATAWHRQIIYLLLLWAAYQLGSIASLGWQFELSYFLTDALEVVQVAGAAVLLRRLMSFDLHVDYRKLLAFAGLLFGVVCLTTFLQAVLIAWLDTEPFLRVWTGWMLSAFIPLGLAFAACYAVSDQRVLAIDRRYLVVPISAVLLLLGELSRPSLYMDHVLFAVAAALLLVIPLRHFILPLSIVVLIEFLTLPSDLVLHNENSRLGGLSAEEVSITLTLYVLGLLGLATLLERLKRESDRTLRLDRSLAAGLQLSGSYVVEVDSQTLVAHNVGGGMPFEARPLFELTATLNSILAPDFREAGLELLKRRNAKETLKFVDPETGEFAYWGRLWVSEEYNLNGRATFLLVVQTVTDEVNLNNALEHALLLRSEAERAISLSIYDVNMDTLDGQLVVGELQEEFSELAGGMIDRMRLAMLPQDFEVAKLRLADPECIGVFDYRIPLDSEASNSIWLRVHYGSERHIGGERRRFVMSWDVTSERMQLDKLAAYERRLAAVVSATDIAIFEINLKTDVVWINESGRAYLNIPTRVPEEHSRDLHQEHLTDDSFEELNELVEMMRSGATEVNAEVSLRLRGEPELAKYCVVRARRSENSLGDPIMLGSMVDITIQQEALRRTENALAVAEASQEELRKMGERQARMFAVIGHELRTPASAINMMLEATPRAQLGEYADPLRSSSAQLLQVLEDLRTVAQPGELRKTTQETASPARVVRQTAMSLELELGAKGVVLHTWTHEITDRQFDFNVQAMRQILTILLRNVAIHSGASNVWVGLYQRKLENGLAVMQLKVEDDGTGVPTEHRDRLFESFYRVNEMREGSGLGLNIAKSLAETLDGSVEYFDSRQGGAGFALTMRLAINNASLVESEEASRAFEIDGCNVLLAEDNPTIQLLTATILRKAGANVIVADDGEKALDLFSQNGDVDLVITDIFMPNLDGFGLTEELRARGFKGVVIGATAATVGEEISRLKQVGASAVLSKPLTLSTLRRTLNDLSSL